MVMTPKDVKEIEEIHAATKQASDECRKLLGERGHILIVTSNREAGGSVVVHSSISPEETLAVLVMSAQIMQAKQAVTTSVCPQCHQEKHSPDCPAVQNMN